MQNEALIRAFEVCLQQVQNGVLPDRALEIYPQWQNELLQPLEAAQALTVYADQISIPPEIQPASRDRFISRAAGLRNRTSYTAAWQRHRKMIFWSSIVLLVTLSLVGLAALTSSSLPGTRLYQVKELLWGARIMVVADPSQRLDLEYSIDAQRLDDIQKLARLGRSAAVLFPIGIQAMEGDRWFAQDLQFLITPKSQIIGQLQPGFYLLVAGSTRPDGTIEIRQVRPREYVFTGMLQRIDGEKALIAGVPVQITGQTVILGAPEPGEEVVVHALRRISGQLSARLIELAGEDIKKVE